MPMDLAASGFEERDRPFHVGGRVVAGLAAVGVGLGSAATAAAVHANGLVLTAVLLPLLALPFALFLLLVAIAPGLVQRAVAGRSRLDLRDGGHVFALLLVVGVLFSIFGWGSGEAIALYESEVLGRGDLPPARAVGDAQVVSGLVLNLLLLTVPPIVWTTFVGEMGLPAAMRALGLKREGAERALVEGAAFAVAAIFAIALASAAVEALGYPVPKNERALDIALGISIPVAIAIAVVSSVSEEILFRGFLLPRVGLLPHALLFSLAHLAYLHVLEMVVTFVLALGFAWLYRRSGNLWAPIAGHFAFNLIMLLLGRFATGPP